MMNSLRFMVPPLGSDIFGFMCLDEIVVLLDIVGLDIYSSKRYPCFCAISSLKSSCLIWAKVRRDRFFPPAFLQSSQ
jgi:hypothetical protein